MLLRSGLDSVFNSSASCSIRTRVCYSAGNKVVLIAEPCTRRRFSQAYSSSPGRFKSTNQPTAEKKFRSKHYKPPSSTEPATEKRLLEPHVLSARLKGLCDERKIDTAVSMLKNSPLDAQNVPVWNTMIWECLKAERFQLAYELYADMKRRGHRPNTRTFQTLLSGLSRIENWSSHPKQLSRAHSIYQSFRRLVEDIKKNDPSSAEFSVQPIAAYVKILGDAGLHQEIFDVFYSLDNDGPMAPNHLLFTAMFRALAAKPGSDTGYTQNAASAKLLWNFMLRASKKNKFPVDGFVVSSAIIALSRGREGDQDFAFQLAAEYFGLTGPESPPNKGTIPLEPQSLASVLLLCRNSERYKLAIHFFANVLQRPEATGGASIVDRAHVESVIHALSSAEIPEASAKALELLEWMLAQELQGRNSFKIRPTYSTFNLVLLSCWKHKDWVSAARTFDLMTGYHCHDFMDGVVSDKPRFDKRSPGRNIYPTAETVSLMVRTALASENRAHLRQALRLVSHIRMRPLLESPPSKVQESTKASKERYFYVSKLANAVLEGIEILFSQSAPNDKPRDDDIVRWKRLKSEAKELAGEASDDFLPTETRQRAKPNRPLSTPSRTWKAL